MCQLSLDRSNEAVGDLCIFVFAIKHFCCTFYFRLLSKFSHRQAKGVSDYWQLTEKVALAFRIWNVQLFIGTMFGLKNNVLCRIRIEISEASTQACTSPKYPHFVQSSHLSIGFAGLLWTIQQADYLKIYEVTTFPNLIDTYFQLGMQRFS